MVTSLLKACFKNYSISGGCRCGESSGKMLREIHARHGAVHNKCSRPAPDTAGWLKPTGIRAAAEEQPSSSLTGSDIEFNPLFSMVQNLTPSLTMSTWSSNFCWQKIKRGWDC